MLQLTYKLFDFNTPDKARGNKVNRESFERYIESPKFKESLNNRILFGDLSHGVRDDFKNLGKSSIGTHADLILKNGGPANIMTDLRIEGDDVVCDLLVPDNDKGRSIQMLRGLGSNIQVSMSIYSNISGGQYHTTAMSGVDFTTQPAFDTEVLNTVKLDSINFSASPLSSSIDNYINPDNSVIVNFSSSSLMDTKVTDQLVNFSNSPSDTNISEELLNFSLRTYITERRSAPQSVINSRIQQIARYINSNKPELVSAQRQFIIDYLNTYIYSLVMKYMQSLKDKKPTNLLLALGIRKYLATPNIVSNLQRVLRNINTQMAQSHFVNRQNQQLLTSTYNEMFAQILDYIELKYINEDKHGILVLTSK